jgi:hypothetical protein
VSRPASRVAFGLAVAVNLAVLYYPRHVAQGGIPGIDKVVHIVVFAAVAWTGVRAGLPVRWLLAVLVVHAVSSELVQHFLLTNRSGDPADSVADVLGAVLGVGAGRHGGSWRDDRAGGRDHADRPAAGRDAHPG